MILFLGLGRMGLPMAKHLLSAGMEVTGYDPDQQRMDMLAMAGGALPQSLSVALREADAVMIMTGSEAQVADLFNRDEGIIAGCRPGTLVLVISTVSPAFMEGLGEQARQAQLRLIDAPVCRAEMGAISGTLLAFLAGAENDCNEAAELIRPFSADIEYVGTRHGAAQIAKTVNNLILWACVAANYEGLKLAESWQLDVDALRRALMTSSAENWSLRHWDRIGEMPWSIKDMEIALATAEMAGVTLPLSEKVSALVKEIEVLSHA
jgi:3-hydroxyisobutyrate dehydrogenase-like beta-hydroxyacid dehydrogenase